MVDSAINAASSLIQFAIKLKEQKETIDIEIKKITIDVTAIQKGLYIYKTIILDNEDLSVKHLSDSITRTQKLIEKITKRSFITSYCSSGSDLKNLQNSQILIRTAFEALQKMVDMGKNGVEMEKIQKKLNTNQQVDHTLKSEASRIFWKNHVQDSVLPMSIYNFGQYFKSFLSQYNSSDEGQENPIKIMYLEPIFAKIVECGQNGFVELHEIEHFFIEWWENEEKRQQFIKKLEANDDMIDESIFLFQALREVNCEHYYPLFKYSGFNHNLFLELSYEKLKFAFGKQITDLEIVKIASYIDSLKSLIKYYKNLEHECLKMKAENMSIYKEAQELKYQNKLSKQQIKDNKHVEEAYYQFPNGCGLTYLKDIEGSTYLGLSQNYEPVSPFMIKYDEGEDGEVNVVNLTKDYSEYFGFYYILNQDAKKPFQMFAEHVGSQKRNDMKMQGYKKYQKGQIMGYIILDREISDYEIPEGRQIYFDLQQNMMIKYFKWGVEVTFQEYQDYSHGKKKMSKVYAKQMIAKQKNFVYNESDTTSVSSRNSIKRTEKYKVQGEIKEVANE